MKLIFLKFKKMIYIIFTFNISLYKSFLFFFSAPSLEHKFILNKKYDYNIVLDIGFNKGQFSSLILSKRKVNKIYAFDPLIISNKVYNKIYKKNKNFFFYDFCLSDKNSLYDFYITKKDDSSSIFFPINKKIKNKISVKGYIFDSLDINFNTNDIVLLKIDVQGSELKILKGMNNYLNKIKYLIIEMSFIEQYSKQDLFAEIHNYLLRYNFKIIKEYNVVFEKGKKIQSDFFYEKK